MKILHLAFILLAAAAGPVSAKADTLFISLDAATQSGSPGDTLQFFGTIMNTSGSTVFLNSDSFSFTGFDSSVLTDLFANTPLSLDPGETSSDVELFDISIPNPFSDPCVAALTCGGSYQILGGVDDSASDVQGTTFFTVNVQEPTGVPEPGTVALLSGGLGLFFIVQKKIRFPAINRVPQSAQRASHESTMQPARRILSTPPHREKVQAFQRVRSVEKFTI